MAGAAGFVRTQEWRRVGRNIFCNSVHYSNQHEALIIVIKLYLSEIELSGLILWLFFFFFWMRHLGYLASSVPVVKSLLMDGRLLCGEGLWRQDCSTAERKKEGPGSCAHSHFHFFFSKLQTAALRPQIDVKNTENGMLPLYMCNCGRMNIGCLPDICRYWNCWGNLNMCRKPGGKIKNNCINSLVTARMGGR